MIGDPRSSTTTPVYHWRHERIGMEQVLMIMASRTTTLLEHQIEQAKDLGIKVRTIGYGLQSDPPAEKRRLGLRDEQGRSSDRAGFAEEYDGQLKKLLLLYAD